MGNEKKGAKESRIQGFEWNKRKIGVKGQKTRSQTEPVENFF